MLGVSALARFVAGCQHAGLLGKPRPLGGTAISTVGRLAMRGRGSAQVMIAAWGGQATA